MIEAKRKLCVAPLGTISYKKGLKIQRDCIEIVKKENYDILLVLEHLPTITLGKNATDQDLIWSQNELEKRSIEIVSTERGGKLTAHNPGQLVGYPIFDIKKHALGTRDFVTKIELALQDTLKRFKIDSEVFRDKPGVWVDDKKVAALGFRVSEGVSSHGFAINIRNNLEIFQGFNPCGYSSDHVTSMERILGADGPSLSEVADVATELIAKSFNHVPETIDIANILK